MEYPEYVDKVLALLDKTDVPTAFNIAHALTGITTKEHAETLDILLRLTYSHNFSVEDAADIIRDGVLEAFTDTFTKKERKH